MKSFSKELLQHLFLEYPLLDIKIEASAKAKGSRCVAGWIKSDSLDLKAQCVCREAGMLINVFGATPPQLWSYH